MGDGEKVMDDKNSAQNEKNEQKKKGFISNSQMLYFIQHLVSVI